MAEKQTFLDKIGLAQILTKLKNHFASKIHMHQASDITDMDNVLKRTGGIPFPTEEITMMGDDSFSLVFCSVNILDLKLDCAYMSSEETIDYILELYPATVNIYVKFIMKCEDGTIKIIDQCNAYNAIATLATGGTNTIWLYPTFDHNYMHIIDIADVSTSDHVSFRTSYNSRYLNTYTNYEYTPVDDYNPSTKKYVDDSISTNYQTLYTELKEYVDTEFTNLINAAQETLDTIGELAIAFQENKDMIETLDDAITLKSDQADLEATQESVNTNATNISSLQSQVLSDSLILTDANTGILYAIQIQNGQLVSFPVEE